MYNLSKIVLLCTALALLAFDVLSIYIINCVINYHAFECQQEILFNLFVLFSNYLLLYDHL